MTTKADDAIVPILKRTLANDAFRQTVITGDKSQVVLMTLQPGEEIGAEVHGDHDQILVFVEGTGRAVLAGNKRTVNPGDLAFIHAGIEHNFINTGAEPLRLYTIYAPPEHPHGTRHESKQEADAAEDHH